MLSDWCTPGTLPPVAFVDAAAGGRSYRAARWDSGSLAAVAARLAERGSRALAEVPLERRLAAWCAAVESLLDPESEERRELFPALLATARLSVEGLSEALEVVLGGAGSDAAAELAARRPAATAPGVDAVILAANVPALAAQSLLPALVAGRPLLLRSSSLEPLAAPALVAALARREPALGEAFAAVTFPHTDGASWDAAFAGCRRVLAYGSATAIAALAGTLGDRLVALGPKASVAFVAGPRDALAAGRALARDVALLDQRGCLSVHAIYAEGDAQELADALVFGLAMEHRRLPPGPAEPEALARLQQLRRDAALAGTLVGELDPHAGTVLAEPGADFRPGPGLRTVRVHAVRSLADAVAALEPRRELLQGAALAGEAALAGGDELAARLGLARVAAAGRLQHAEAGWASGGIDPLAVFA